MPLLWFLVAVLGVWRVSHLLAAEDGPFALVARLRAAAGGGFWGSLLDCFKCLSLWVAAPFALATGESWRERMLLWPALSGGAILVDMLTAGPPAPAPYFEAPAEDRGDDGVLRR